MSKTSIAIALTCSIASGSALALDADVVSLAEWRYDELYQTGMSADTFIDEMEVYGPTGEEIGDVEDVLVGSDGKVVAIIAEVGGVWDMGDTHVSIPWEEVDLDAMAGGITVPITEESVDDYGVYDSEYISRSEAARSVVAGTDAAIAGDRLWRVSELLGDYARLRQDEGFANYGYVNDVILKDGEVAAVVVQPDTGYGVTGYRAYPYYGYDRGYGWTPGSPYYDLPYTEADVAELEEFDRTQLAQ